ncbi:MAG TPA: hypothetical protein VFF52_21460 [Isosphaeraceae bacterium]|nr:hypothetical protein [Isosphaeraceae bacterium]
MGQPVADAQVVFSAPFSISPVVMATRTDAQGRFHLTYSRLGQVLIYGVHVWAYRPGSALAAAWIRRLPPTLVLRKPAPRHVKLEGPDGNPIAGARIAPRVLSVAGDSGEAWTPEPLLEPLTVTTGPDGRAAIACLGPRDQLVAVRVSADSIGTQNLKLAAGAGRGTEDLPITIRLGKTSRLAGRVVDQAGQPVADALYAGLQGVRSIVLPLVEQIDPALVPELFWRAVAARLPIGNPGVVRQEVYNAVLVPLVAWYDREVAQVLFQPVRAQIEHTDNLELAGSSWADAFLGWSLLDPRAAVARLEKVPVTPRLELNADWARTYLAEVLGLPYEQRWRRVGSDRTLLNELLERDIR